jgi:uncharacterized membrane-anchored protein
MTKISSLFHHRFTEFCFFEHRTQDPSITVMRSPAMVPNAKSGGFMFNSLANVPERRGYSKNRFPEIALSKVPEVTLAFWIIKIAATTLGETGGDSVTMTLNWGYLTGTALFLSLLVVLVIAQIFAKRFHPLLYWATIVASTTFGTTMADFADRSLGIGYTGGSTLLLVCLAAVLGLWYWSEGTISVNTVTTPKVEAFYWTAITFSQTLGTALGDWIADTGGLGYEGGAFVFAGGLAVIGGLYLWTNVSGVLLFWSAFILTRPLGATVGDFLDKPVSHGGLAFSRPLASAVIAVFVIVCLFVLPQRAGRHPGASLETTD